MSDIAGKAQVGRTLTTSAATVADVDGLPSALNYKWYRVDGSNVEMEINGATGTTYTPAAADLGHTLKVKVSFYDNLGGEEVRESLETPTVEQPPAAPGDLTAEAGDGRVRLVWTEPSDNGGAAITGYQFRSAQGASVPAVTAWSPLSPRIR